MDGKIWTFYERNRVPANTGQRIKAGYARVSSLKQKLQRQYDDIKAACPDAVIFSEIFTGTSNDRPEWQKLLKLCRHGLVSEIWFCEVSRMSRREDGFDTYMELVQMGIELHFISEPQLDTTTYKNAIEKAVTIKPMFNDEAINVLVNSIFSAVNDYMVSLAKKQIMIAYDEAAQEAKDLSQRTKEGMAVAKIRGNSIGRREGVSVETWKRKKAVAKIRKHYKKYGGSLNGTECASICGITKSTFYRYVREIDDELMGNPKTWDYHSQKPRKTS